MSNILTAIKAIVESSNLEVINGSDGVIQNRTNQMGAALEDYVKNAFADCLGKDARTIGKINRNSITNHLISHVYIIV